MVISYEIYQTSLRFELKVFADVILLSSDFLHLKGQYFRCQYFTVYNNVRIKLECLPYSSA